MTGEPHALAVKLLEEGRLCSRVDRVATRFATFPGPTAPNNGDSHRHIFAQTDVTRITTLQSWTVKGVTPTEASDHVII